MITHSKEYDESFAAFWHIDISFLIPDKHGE